MTIRDLGTVEGMLEIHLLKISFDCFYNFFLSLVLIYFIRNMGVYYIYHFYTQREI